MVSNQSPYPMLTLVNEYLPYTIFKTASAVYQENPKPLALCTS